MEGFGSLVFLVGLFWTLLHLLQALFSRRRNRQSLALPVPALSGLHSHPGSLRTTSLRIALHKLYLRIEFSGLNRSHDKFTTILQRTERSKQRRYLTLLYDLGTALCCAGMVAAIGILFWATFQLLLALGSNVGVHPVVQPVTSTVVKRNFDSDPLPEVAPSSSIGTSNLSIQLLVSTVGNCSSARSR